MNLFWLRYVSYIFLGLAVLLYLAARLRWPVLGRTAKILLYLLCVALACACWRAQEANAERHSPRQLLMGQVAWVSVNGRKSGSIEDNFQLQLGGGRLSPKFSTGAVASSAAKQPLHTGDTLGVLYRTWDDAVVTIDEIDGQYPGWHYRRADNGNAYVFGVGFGGFVGLIGLLLVSRAQRNSPAEPEFTGLKLDD